MSRLSAAVAVCCVLTGLLLADQPAGAEELNCLKEAERSEAQLYRNLQNDAYAALDRRLKQFEQLETVEQIRNWQKARKEFFIERLGGFPDKTSLNAETVRTIDADGYRIEMVIFESQPNHHITANLYLPDADRPVPGVAVSSGHSRTAKTADYNQRFGIMMARHGMAALCFDPIGQGERSQILDADHQPKFNGTTTEHFLMGVGSILVGRNTARYRVWDAIRAIDYLASRPEIDGKKIGMTGCSGGGTLTSYVMALDDRVVCAAPSCYLTTFRKLIEEIGPQDAEQNIYGQVAFGMDQPDYVLMRGPQPTLISCTTGDFFPIEGTWDNFRQSRRIYGKLGFPERVDLVEVEGRHGVFPQNLATIAHWMKRWLLNRDEPVEAVELPTRAESELLCLNSGQVLTLPGEKSVFDLNAEYEQKLADRRESLWQSTPEKQLRKKIRKRLRLSAASDRTTPEWEDRGRVDRDDYHIDRLVLKSADGHLLPALTFHPPDPADAAYLYLHDSGKTGDSQPGSEIEQLVKDGYAVVSVDLRGQGETAQGERDELLTDWKTYFLAYLLEKPLVGLRVEDTLTATDFVAFYQKKQDDPRPVHLIGSGQAGIVALHTAALHPDRFESVTLKDTPRSWSQVVSDPTPRGQLDSTVHGALELYDLPDLVSLCGKDRVSFDK